MTFVIDNGDVHWFTSESEAEDFWKSASSDAELVGDPFDHPEATKVADGRRLDYTLHNENGVFVHDENGVITKTYEA
jgi:hypothetical protein